MTWIFLYIEKGKYNEAVLIFIFHKRIIILSLPIYIYIFLTSLFLKLLKLRVDVF